MDLFLSYHLLVCTNPTILLDAMLQAFILCLFLSIMLYVVQICYPKYDMNKSFRIIFIKINIIKVNIIKIYTKNTHFITRKCDIVRIFIKKDYIIVTKYRIIKCFNISFCNKPIKVRLVALVVLVENSVGSESSTA